MLKLVLGVMLVALILLLHGISRTPDNYRSAEFPEEQMPAAMKTVDEVANLPAGAQLYFRDSNRPFAVVVALIRRTNLRMERSLPGCKWSSRMEHNCGCNWSICEICSRTPANPDDWRDPCDSKANIPARKARTRGFPINPRLTL